MPANCDISGEQRHAQSCIYKNVYSAFGFQRLSLDVIFVIVVVLGFTHTRQEAFKLGYSHIFLYIALQTPLTIVVLHYNLVNSNIAAAVVKYSMFIEKELLTRSEIFWTDFFKKYMSLIVISGFAHGHIH